LPYFFYRAGNLDYLHPASVFSQVKWPGNVKFLQLKKTKVILEEKKTAYGGRPYLPAVEHLLLRVSRGKPSGSIRTSMGMFPIFFTL
jgi:hypothetical protein